MSNNYTPKLDVGHRVVKDIFDIKDSILFNIKQIL